MFIRKWRYQQNLENARQEGIKEGVRLGKREANEQKLAYLEYLEQENKALQDKLVEAEGAIERQRQELESGAIPKKSIVEALANELACYWKCADVAFYELNDKNARANALDKGGIVEDLANFMAIGGDVRERAYQIYDFRNSGKKGYTLKDGKIVKIEQEETAVACPFGAEQAPEDTVENCPEAETAVCCPEVSDIPDNRENLCTMQGCCDEESFF